MAYIVETIVGDKRLQLGNEQFYRKMAIGSNWNSVRVGVRMCYNATSTVNAAPFLGVSSGPYNYNGGSADHVFGAMAQSDLSQVGWGYNAGPPSYVRNNTTNRFNAATKVGATVNNTYSGVSDTSFLAGSVSGTAYFSVDITKGSGTMTVSAIACNSTLVGISKSDFLRQLESSASVLSAASAVTASGPVNYAGSYNLSHVFVYWSLSTPTMEISDLAVLRYS